MSWRPLSITERLIELLAWLCRQKAQPTGIGNPDTWPSVCLMHWPNTINLVFLDHDFFALAKRQVTADFLGLPQDYTVEAPSYETNEAAAILLTVPEPQTNRPSRTENIAIEMIVQEIQISLEEH
jgi:hypothetical protein